MRGNAHIHIAHRARLVGAFAAKRLPLFHRGSCRAASRVVPSLSRFSPVCREDSTGLQTCTPSLPKKGFPFLAAHGTFSRLPGCLPRRTASSATRCCCRLRSISGECRATLSLSLACAFFLSLALSHVLSVSLTLSAAPRVAGGFACVGVRVRQARGVVVVWCVSADAPRY